MEVGNNQDRHAHHLTEPDDNRNLLDLQNDPPSSPSPEGWPHFRIGDTCGWPHFRGPRGVSLWPHFRGSD